MNTAINLECSLNGAIARVARAAEHINTLAAGIESIRQAQKDAITFEPGNENEPPFKLVTQHLSIPLQFGVLLGEICYNLRVALDYLVYELAILNSGNVVDQTQFPIEDTREGFLSQQKRGRLRGLSSTHVEAIEALQPYRGCDWTSVLRDLSNPDKHKRLLYHQGSYELKIYSEPDRLRFLDIPGEIVTLQHPVTGKETRMMMDLTLEVEFDDGIPVVETLRTITKKVAQTLQSFEPEFAADKF